MRPNCVGSIISQKGPITKALIAVEGPADKHFLEEYLAHLGYPENLFRIHVSGGWTNWKTVTQELAEAEDNNLPTALIYDADSNLFSRRNELQSKLNNIKSKARIFLLPNDQEMGCLEDLLKHLVPSKYEPVTACFDRFMTEVRELSPALVPSHNLPDPKTKFYSYASLLLEKKDKEKKEDKENPASERHRPYKGVEYWDLNAPYLDDLKEFIENLLKIE